MNLGELKADVTRITRDFSNSIFRTEDVVAFLNDAVRRIKQLNVFQGMNYLEDDTDSVILLPEAYHSLLPLYCSSRLFFQDERFYQAQTLMNEFEIKLDELYQKILIGEVVVIDPDGNPITFDLPVDYVIDNYFFKKNSVVDENDESVDTIPS